MPYISCQDTGLLRDRTNIKTPLEVANAIKLII